MKTPKEAKSIKDVKIKPINVEKIQGEEFPPEYVEADSKQIEKPAYIAKMEEIIKKNQMKKFFNENIDTAEDCMEALAIINDYKPFDSERARASYVFAGAILTAMNAFAFRLGYGGHAEYRKKDKLAIIKHLQKIHEILKK